MAIQEIETASSTNTIGGTTLTINFDQDSKDWRYRQQYAASTGDVTAWAFTGTIVNGLTADIVIENTGAGEITITKPTGAKVAQEEDSSSIALPVGYFCFCWLRRTSGDWFFNYQIYKDQV